MSLFWIFHVNWIIQCVALCVWLLSASLKPRITHAVAWCPDFFSIYGWNMWLLLIHADKSSYRSHCAFYSVLTQKLEKKLFSLRYNDQALYETTTAILIIQNALILMFPRASCRQAHWPTRGLGQTLICCHHSFAFPRISYKWNHSVQHPMIGASMANMEIGEEKLSTKQFSITKFPREIERGFNFLIRRSYSTFSMINKKQNNT